jgi:predicted DNA-binding transcriptional regulator YafY
MKNGMICRQQLSRLFRIVLELQSSQSPNARALSSACGVSRRTVYRDLEALAQAGVPVHYCRHRQGYSIDPAFSMTPPRLEEDEALALLVIHTHGQSREDRSLTTKARAGLLKVVETLPAPTRSSCRSLLEFLPRETDSTPQPTSGALFPRLLDALATRQQIRVTYQDPSSGDPVVTRIIPRELGADAAGWFLIGRSSVHRGLRAIRVVDMLEITVLDQPIQFDESPHARAQRHPAVVPLTKARRSDAS